MFGLSCCSSMCLRSALISVKETCFITTCPCVSVRVLRLCLRGSPSYSGLGPTVPQPRGDDRCLAGHESPRSARRLLAPRRLRPESKVLASERDPSLLEEPPLHGDPHLRLSAADLEFAAVPGSRGERRGAHRQRDRQEVEVEPGEL